MTYPSWLGKLVTSSNVFSFRVTSMFRRKVKTDVTCSICLVGVLEKTTTSPTWTMACSRLTEDDTESTFFCNNPGAFLNPKAILMNWHNRWLGGKLSVLSQLHPPRSVIIHYFASIIKNTVRLQKKSIRLFFSVNGYEPLTITAFNLQWSTQKRSDSPFFGTKGIEAALLIRTGLITFSPSIHKTSCFYRSLVSCFALDDIECIACRLKSSEPVGIFTKLVPSSWPLHMAWTFSDIRIKLCWHRILSSAIFTAFFQSRLNTFS